MKVQEQISLKSISNGTKVRLLKIQAGQGLNARLAVMGLLPGSQLIVINNGHPGPFIVDIKGTRIVLGKGIASKMFVRAMES